MHKIEPGTDLIPAQSVEYLVGQYNLAVERIRSAFRLFGEAETGLKTAYGNYSTFHHLSIRESPEGLIKDITKNFWNYVFTVTKMRDVLTVNRRDQLDRMIGRGEMPEITVDNVSDLMASLKNQAPDLMAEFITETFNFLRPSGTGLKTNAAPELGKKVIVEYMVDTSYGLTRLHYRREQALSALDNTFSLLDGKGLVSYPGDSKTAINESIRAKRFTTQTEYFDFKWFKNGNLHIVFRRPDLVERLNQVAGRYILKQDLAA